MRNVVELLQPDKEHLKKTKPIANIMPNGRRLKVFPLK